MDGYIKYRCLHPPYKVEFKNITENNGNKKKAKIKKSFKSDFSFHKAFCIDRFK